MKRVPVSTVVPGLRRALSWVLLVGCGLAVGWMVRVCDYRPPTFESVQMAWTPSESVLLDRRGEWLHTLRTDLRVRRLAWVRLADVSPALVKAVLAAEDRRFYQHGGVDWRALLAGLRSLLPGGGAARGGSTLTMQTAALLDNGLQRSGGRRSALQKLRQVAAAIALERRWSKAQILEAYLNRVVFRGELQGVAATAQAYFEKHPSGLTTSESLLLAALLRAPNQDAERLARRACALARPAELAVDCDALAVGARALASRKPSLAPPVALAEHLARRLLKTPGTAVRTTLDAGVQRVAKAAVEQQLLGLAAENVRDGAAVAVANDTGEIVAYVGGAGPASRSKQVDGAQARRQAGSTLKPFLYGMAVERRYLTAASILEDSPVNLETAGGLYIPQNYDRDFRGRVSVRTALASSLNVPAVRTLVLAGVEAFRQRLWDLGYRGIDRPGEYYGYSLALGSAEVSLLEQVNAFRTLANGGVWTPLRVRPDEPQVEPRRVFDAESAFVIADILSDNASRAPTFGLDSPLGTSFWSAAKTGTSKDMRDNWCVGFSTRYTVGVWVGNFEGDSMHAVSGVSGAAPAWLAIMQALHADEPPAPPTPPAGLQKLRVSFEAALEPPRAEWFLPNTELSSVQVLAQTPRARITAPPRGAIVALDPDIPAGRQQLLFSAVGAAGLRWVLDGQELGEASAPREWLPRPGRHLLELRGGGGQALDNVHFVVRDVQR